MFQEKVFWTREMHFLKTAEKLVPHARKIVAHNPTKIQ